MYKGNTSAALRSTLIHSQYLYTVFGEEGTGKKIRKFAPTESLKYYGIVCCNNLTCTKCKMYINKAIQCNKEQKKALYMNKLKRGSLQSSVVYIPTRENVRPRIKSSGSYIWETKA